MTTNLKITILGLGLMGGGMARTLVAKGFTVAVWNRDPSRAAPLSEAGARVATTPADAVTGADVVIAMLAHDDASRAVWLGEDGALAALAPHAIAIESSTLTLAWVRELAAAAGPRFLDAPVTGSRAQAESGALKFLVGGDADVLTTARPVLDALGTDVAHLGPIGSGALLKLINNFMCGMQVATLAEALAMAERSGLDAARAADILAGGAPGSPLVRALADRMLARDYTPNFLVPLMAKDLDYATAAFAEAGITLATAQAARARFLTAADAGHAEKDIAAIIEPLRAGGE